MSRFGQFTPAEHELLLDALYALDERQEGERPAQVKARAQIEGMRKELETGESAGQRFKPFVSDERRHLANALRGEIAFLSTHNREFAESGELGEQVKNLLDEVEEAGR